MTVIVRPLRRLVSDLKRRRRRLVTPTVRANLRRWSDPAALRADWDERTGRLARLVPAGSSVVEFGAGRMVLKDMLAEGCAYTPSDIVDRGPGTVVCDLNEGFPALGRRYGHAVFSGVLEYVTDLSRLAGSLAGAADTVIASYATLEGEPDRGRRRAQGWLSHHTDREVVSAFEAAGFRLARRDVWHDQSIYVFEHAPARPLAAGERSAERGGVGVGVLER